MHQPQSLYSIGYATKPIDIYIEQLQRYGIDVVADIRSVPYSKVFHDYHQEALKSTLKAAGIGYVYLGLELGPRSKDTAHYDETNQVQFDWLMQSELFVAGIERLFSGLEKGFTIAMTCAEKDPAICHRSLLVGWALTHRYRLELQHILHDGNFESQAELEYRLLSETNTLPDMLMSETEALALAYQRQCRVYAYRIPEDV